MAQRNQNHGLRKICDCGRRHWPKCSHDWHFNFTWRKHVYRFSLDRQLGRQVSGKTEAQREANRLRAEIQSGTFGSERPRVGGMTLRQLVAQYVQRAKAARPQDNVDVLCGTALPRPAGGELAFGEWPVADITTDTIERFREVRSVRRFVRRRGQSVERVAGGVIAANRHLAFLRGVFNWAIRVGCLERTPFKRGDRNGREARTRASTSAPTRARRGRAIVGGVCSPSAPDR